MLRLPSFRYLAPRTLAEAADMLASSPGAAIVAGGTDLLPNMKRRQQTPSTLIGIRQIPELRQLSMDGAMSLGSGLSLTDIVRNGALRASATALWEAAAQVATPQIRNTATLGGNLCIDTRCNYYDQSFEWRKAIGFCMKKDGDTCWVAPGSRRCLAVSSTDTAPALLALDASVVLTSAAGSREIPLVSLYRNDGIACHVRRPDEVLSVVRVPCEEGWRSTYWKVRRRGSFDFPVLSVGAAVRLTGDGTVGKARLVLGAIASCPIAVPEAADSLVGHGLTDATIANAAELASRPARPMDNTDFTLHWRKRMVRELVGYALRELREDDAPGSRLQAPRSRPRLWAAGEP